MLEKYYINTIKYIKEEILKSRYTMAKVANKEMLFLYYKVGKIISEKVETEKWGSKTIKRLSEDLQNELHGLRGFSSTNLKRMKKFFDEWEPYFRDEISQNLIGSTLIIQMIDKQKSISPTVSDPIENTGDEISSTLSDQFVNYFCRVPFSSHFEIITKTKSIESRIFYISKSAQEFWSVRTLRHHLKNNLFEQQGQLPNNFETAIETPQNRERALRAFKDHYLLDFIRISDEDADDEKVLENEIVNNIKKFIMSLGSDFAFLGNQYRVIVEDDEYFIDLLFFNRSLQSLVAFDLKTGKFKPEYLGKMNFYLSALDDLVKQKHESPSIGIILCKEKKNKTVEFAFRDMSKAMGVATYKTSNHLPEKYKNILPDANTLIKLLD